MKGKIKTELSYKELEDLVEMLYVGKEIIYSGTKSKSKFDKVYNHFITLYQEATLLRSPDKAEDMENIQEYLSACCHEHIIKFEDSVFPELLAWKLAEGIDRNVSSLREKLKPLFEKD